MATAVSCPSTSTAPHLPPPITITKVAPYPRPSITKPAPAAFGESVMASAVARLHAAGDDLEALAEALQAATFLETVPGDYRQKLRAARTRLRSLQAVAAKAAAGGDVAGRSPHTRPNGEYSSAEFDRYAGLHEQLGWRLVSKPGGATVKPDDYYRLAALHSQALHGDNSAERPMWAERGGLDFEGRARWDAWTALQGLAGDKARQRYVKLLHEFSPAALYKDARAQLLQVAAAPTAAAAAGQSQLQA